MSESLRHLSRTQCARVDVGPASFDHFAMRVTNTACVGKVIHSLATRSMGPDVKPGNCPGNPEVPNVQVDEVGIAGPTRFEVLAIRTRNVVGYADFGDIVSRKAE